MKPIPLSALQAEGRRSKYNILLLCVMVVVIVGILPTASAQDSAESTEKAAESTEKANDTGTGSPTESPLIKVESDSTDDALLKQRLVSIFQEVDALADIEIQVASSVITLTGTVDSVEEADLATELANKLEGVAQVVNTIDINRDVGERVENALDKSASLAQQTIQLLPLLVLAIGVMIVTWWLGRWVGNRHSFLTRFTPNLFIAQLVATIFRIMVVLGGLITALYLLDLTSIIGTVLGAAGIVGLALGFAVRDTVENFIASVLLSIRHPFSTDDYIDIDGIEGSVARLTSRATILISPDGNHVRIPNAQVFKAVIVNYTRQAERRIGFTIPVDENADVSSAFSAIGKTLAGIEAILDKPAPVTTIEKLGDTTILLGVYFWIDQRYSDYLATQSRAMAEIKRSFRTLDIDMPSSQQVVQISRMDKSAGTSKAVTQFQLEQTEQKPDQEYVAIDTRAVQDNTLKQTEKERDAGENLLSASANSE